MICRGLKNNKMTLEEAMDKYDEFIELELIDEDHQEKVENLIAEAEEDAYYWRSAKKDYLAAQDDFDEEEFIKEEMANDEFVEAEEEYERDFEDDE